MSERALKRILVAVGVLVVIYAGVALLRRSPGTQGGGADGALAELMESLDPEQVSEVRFLQEGDTTLLARADGEWTVDGYPADSSVVARFWEELSEGRVGGVVATNPENHPRLGVSEDSAVHVTFRLDGDDVREVLVGDAGRSRPSAYVRLPGRDAVFLFQGELRGPAGRATESWRDRTVARLDTSRVHTLEVIREEESYTLTRGDEGWTVDGEPVDSVRVRRLLGDLADLRATGFAPDTATFGETDRTLRALGEAGDTLLALSMAEVEESGLRVRAAGDSTIYELSSYRADQIMPEASELRASPEDGSG